MGADLIFHSCPDPRRYPGGSGARPPGHRRRRALSPALRLPLLLLRLMLLAIMLHPVPALAAGTAGERLDTLTGRESLGARFQQFVLDESGAVRERSWGEVALAGPGRFRWHYQGPFEQIIVSDGKQVWVYDPDLAQATVHGADALASAPAGLLGRGATLRERYRVREMGSNDGLDWLQLTPQPQSPDTSEDLAARDGADAQSVYLGFGPEHLEVMELLDGLGQVTSIRFSEVRIDPPLEPELFRFEPPPGTDVIQGG